MRCSPCRRPLLLDLFGEAVRILDGPECAHSLCRKAYGKQESEASRRTFATVMMNKRGALLGGCAAVVVFGSLAVAAPAAAECSGAASGFDAGPCTGSKPSPGFTAPPESGFGTVDGIPCNSHHWAMCIGLSQSQGGGGGVHGIRPGSTVSHSP